MIGYFLFLTRLVFLKIFQTKVSKEKKILINHTFGKTFRFKEKAYKDPFVVLRYYKHLVSLPVVQANPKLSSDTLILGASEKVKNERIKYVSYFDSVMPDFLAYSPLVTYNSRLQKCLYLLCALPFACLFWLSSMFLTNKPSLALTLEYPLALKNIMRILKANGITKVIQFCIYEKHTNLFSYYLMRKGIHITKITSLTPLSIWNSNIITNNLRVNTAYQLEEVTFLQKTIISESIKLWGPERYPSYAHLYGRESVTPPYSIGFYSTASWVRALVGLMDQGIDFEKAEQTVLGSLKNVLKQNPKYSLKIFLHPKEKAEIYFQKTQAHYKKFLGEEVAYSFADSAVPTAHCFQEVDLAVAFNSSVMHERIFCGFKGVFLPENKLFPLKNSKFSAICAASKDELEKLILKSIEQTTMEFFESNGILEYSPRLNEIGNSKV